MSTSPQDPIEIVRSLYPALASGDRAALDALLAADFVGQTTRGLPAGLGGRFDGPQAMRREFWGGIARHYDAAAEPADVRLIGDGQVLVTGRYVGTARSTGRPFEAEFVHVVTVANGRITALDQLTDSAAWAAALESHPVDDPVEFSITDGIATIRLNRPDSANAIDEAVARGVRTAAQACVGNPDIRVVLVIGSGQRFSAGGDLGIFAGLPPERLSGLLDTMITDYHVGLTTLAELDVPVVCAVQGAAAGGALGLMHASDIVLAAEGTKFALGFGLLGLTGDGGSTWYLPRIVGPKVAAQMYLDNRVLTADEALRLGLVSEVVPLDRLHAEAHALATRLAAGPTRTLGAMRALLRNSWTTGLVEQFDLERRAIIAAGTSPNAAEGITAFAERRPPSFQSD